MFCISFVLLSCFVFVCVFVLVLVCQLFCFCYRQLLFCFLLLPINIFFLLLQIDFRFVMANCFASYFALCRCQLFYFLLLPIVLPIILYCVIANSQYAGRSGYHYVCISNTIVVSSPMYRRDILISLFVYIEHYYCVFANV